MLAFGGSRTFHRIAVAIEDAGFELRDTLMWVYGCLSEDTEILTRNGWEHVHISTNDDIIMDKEILVYDVQNDVYQWERPERWASYRVQQDTAYRIQSDHTDQLVSRNHRCLVERGGKLAFVEAEELSGMEYMPTLPDDFLGISEGRQCLLQSGMQRILQRTGLGKARIQGTGRLDSDKRGEFSREDDRPKQSGMEWRPYLFQAQGQVRKPVDQVCSMPTGIHSDGAERWLRNGASINGSSSNGQTVVAFRNSASRQPRCHGQSVRKPDSVCIKCRSQAVRARTSYRASLATITPIEYSGLIFCPTVSTGAFVARRNGKVFITGNSGFPKSLDVSKAIDKAAGAEREVVGKSNRRVGPSQADSEYFGSARDRENSNNITAPATPDALRWQGWGTALKPAWEPIIVARKPLIGTVAANVLEYGTGAINIDGCRVRTEETITNHSRSAEAAKSKGRYGDSAAQETHQTAGQALGRWPANFIHDGSEEVLRLFPKTKPSVRNKLSDNRQNMNKSMFIDGRHGPENSYDDSGSAARFFYCAKASRKERNRGLEDAELKQSDETRKEELIGGNNPYNRGAKPVKNNHPTVKPLALMQYLVRLITPPNGIVLDPFTGSGSTLIAATREGFRYIGIELNEEYIEIAEKRLQAEQPLFEYNNT